MVALGLSISLAGCTMEQDGHTVEGDELLNPSGNSVDFLEDGEDAEAIEAEAPVVSRDEAELTELDGTSGVADEEVPGTEDRRWTYTIFTTDLYGHATFETWDEILTVCDRYIWDGYNPVVYYHTSNNPTGRTLLHNPANGFCTRRNLEIPESGWIRMHVCTLKPWGAVNCSTLGAQYPAA